VLPSISLEDDECRSALFRQFVAVELWSETSTVVAIGVRNRIFPQIARVGSNEQWMPKRPGSRPYRRMDDRRISTSIRVRDSRQAGRGMVPNFIRSALIEHISTY